jgi:hypothetical protein
MNKNMPAIMHLLYSFEACLVGSQVNAKIPYKKLLDFFQATTRQSAQGFVSPTNRLQRTASKDSG